MIMRALIVLSYIVDCRMLTLVDSLNENKFLPGSKANFRKHKHSAFSSTYQKLNVTEWVVENSRKQSTIKKTRVYYLLGL